MADGKIEAKEPLIVSASTDEDVVVTKIDTTTVSVKETETVVGAVIPSEAEGSISSEAVNDTISDAETIIEAEMASETSTEIEVKEDVPELPKISDELQAERKQEFLGLGEEGKVEEEKKDEGENKGEEGDVKGE